MRRLQISLITPSTTVGTPSAIEVVGDFTAIFHGKLWDTDGIYSEWHTYGNSPPAGVKLIGATQFDVIGNSKYNGRYTVYTELDNTGQFPSSSLNGGNTRIRVAETVPVIGSDSPSLLSTGFVTNISTYWLVLNNTPSIVLTETELDTTSTSLELMGRLYSGWGEGLQQNQLKLLQLFSGPTAPLNPATGQLWNDSTTSVVKVFQNGVWKILNENYFGVVYRHAQTAASTTWAITHNMELVAPYIANVQFFVDTPNGVKMIYPADLDFTSANQMTVSFTNAQTGYALIRG